MANIPLLVDPAVARAKFERELATYHMLDDEHLRRGWWLLKAEFPEVFVVFATPQTQPATVVLGVVLDFSNYDLWPPSVRLVNPFTRVPYTLNQLPTTLLRRTIVNMQSEAIPGLPPGATPQLVQDTPLMQAHHPDDIPFLCLPGVREYHEHPAHTGDSWLLHRGNGEGTLYFLLEKIYQYGVQPISGLHVRMMPQIGFARQDAPE